MDASWMMDMLYRYEGVTGLEGSNQAKKVNMELNESKSRKLGLITLNNLLNSCNEDVVSENCGRWITVMTQIIAQVRDSNAARQLASANLRLLLDQSSQISATSREISTRLAATVLTDLLQSSVQDGPVLASILSVITFYPNACGPLRSRLVKCMIPLMIQPFKERRLQAVGCWSQVPFLGGGGPNRSTHATQWEGQMNQTIQALRFALQVFVENDVKGLDPSQGSLTLPFPDLPKKEPELSYVLVQRICTLCECLSSLLNVDFPYTLPVPMQEMVDIVLQMLNIIPSKMGHTTEMLLRASCVQKIHEHVLQLLTKLTVICKRSLCRHSASINAACLNLLDLWKDGCPVAGKLKKHSSVRVRVYTTILNWIQMCGATSRFMCGPAYANQGFLKHLINDVTPVKDKFGIPVAKDSGLSGKAKRRKLAKNQRSLLDGASGGRIFHEKANSELCRASLQVILSSVDTMGHRLQPSIHKSFQEAVIFILLNYQQGKAGVFPYSRCHLSRMLLYKVLLTLTLSPATTLAPPVTIAKQLFTLALSKETNLELRGFCLTAIASVDNVLQPWRTAWHRCTVDVGESMKDLQIGSVIEPMNMKKDNGFCQNCAADLNCTAETGPTKNVFAQISEENEESDSETEMDVAESSVAPIEHPEELGNLVSLNLGASEDNIDGSRVPDSETFPSDNAGAPIRTHPTSVHGSTESDPLEKAVGQIENGAVVTSSYDDVITDDDVRGAENHKNQTNTTSVPEPEHQRMIVKIENGGNNQPEDEEVDEEVDKMLLDFIDASPDKDDE